MAEKSRKKDGGRKPIYDWDLIMNDYVCNRGMSLRKIEKKYGIPHFTISKKSKADDWFATKQEYQKQRQTEIRTEVRTKQVGELAGLVQASDYIEKAILKAFNDPDYFRKHIVSRNLNEEQDTLDILNTKAMKDMMRVIKDVEDVKRSILDIRKSEAAERLEIEKARLALEQERLALEKQKSEMYRPTDGNAIRIEGFEEGWSE